MRCMRCALLFGLALALSPGRGAAEDWDLTREPARSAGKQRSRPGPKAGETPRDPGAGAAERQALLAERYVRVLLGDALDAFALERLLALYRERDGNLDKLAEELAARTVQERERFGLQLLRARVDAARGDREAARAGFARAAELDPRAAAPLVLAAALEREAGELDRAAQLLERALPIASGRARADLLRRLAELALDRKDFARAEQRYAELDEGQGAGVTSAAEYARALAARGEHERAAAAFARAIEAQRGDDRVLPPLLLELARAEIEAGDGAAAQAALERARKLTQPGSGLRYEVDEVSVDVERRLGRLPELVARLAAERSADFARSELLGRLYEELGDGVQALASYRAALARNPRHEASRLRVIQLLTQRGEIEQAIAEYRALVRLSPREPRFVVELGKLLFQAGRREEALALLVQTGQRHPRDARIHRALLELYTRWDEKKRAAEELALLHRIEPDDPAHIVALGEQQLDAGDTDRAIATWKRLLQNAPDKARAHAALGGVLLDHDLPERALAEYEAALQIAEGELEFVRGAAETLERLQRSAEAAQRWQQVLVLATERSLRREARRRVVRLWAASGELARKTAEFERVFAAANAQGGKPDAEAGRFLAECYRVGALGRNQALGDPRKLAAAEAVLVRVIAIEPGDIESLLSLERLRATRGDLNGAIEMLAKLLEADPKNAQSYLARMSEHALSAYRDADAVAYAERLAALSPNDARAHERLGDLYRVRQNGAGAIASYERAVALDDRAFAVMLQLAELHLSRGEIDAADGVLRRVLRTCPDDELVKRAGRSLLQLHLGTDRLRALEQLLSPLALAQSARPVYRRLLVELYEASSRPLIESAREGGPGAEPARAELAALGQRAIKPLLEALADPDPAQSRLAIELLSYLRNEHAAVPLLRAAEAEGDTQQRRRALLGAGAVAKATLAPRFAALARAPERRLRTAAAFGLARMEGAPAIAALRELLGSGSPGVRGYALLGLGRLRDQASQPSMRQALLGDRHAFARGAAALALGLLGDRGAVPALTAALRTEPGEAAAAAAVALALLAERAAAEPLAEAVFTSDAQLRAAALFALSSLARGERAAWPELPEPGDSDERLSLSSLLATFTARLTAADRAAALRAFESELRAAAEAALEGPRETAAAALALLSGRDRALATDEGGSAAAWLASLLPAVAKLAEHPDPALRAEALALLAQADSAVSAAPFVDALADDDPAVQRAALAALGAAPAASAPVARERLARIATTDTRFWMRMRAVNALGRGASEREIAVLIAVLRSDSDAYVREAAASALGELRAAGAAAALRLARERDPEPAVRTSAERALAKIAHSRPNAPR